MICMASNRISQGALKLHMIAILLLESLIENILQRSDSLIVDSLVLWSWEITVDELWILPNIAHYLPLNNTVTIY